MTTLAATDPTTDTGADLATFFLGHLATLAARQAAAASPSERATLAHATFAILLDCQDLGLGAEAQAILAQLRAEPATLAVA